MSMPKMLVNIEETVLNINCNLESIVDLLEDFLCSYKGVEFPIDPVSGVKAHLNVKLDKMPHNLLFGNSKDFNQITDYMRLRQLDHYNDNKSEMKNADIIISYGGTFLTYLKYYFHEIYRIKGDFYKLEDRNIKDIFLYLSIIGTQLIHETELYNVDTIYNVFIIENNKALMNILSDDEKRRNFIINQYIEDLQNNELWRTYCRLYMPYFTYAIHRTSYHVYDYKLGYSVYASDEKTVAKELADKCLSYFYNKHRVILDSETAFRV